MSVETVTSRRSLQGALWAAVWLACAPLAFFVCAFVLTLPQAQDALSTRPAEQLEWLLPLARYALPALCILVALRLGLRALAWLASPAAIQSSDEAEWLRGLAWLQFEHLVEGHFSHRGYRTAHLPRRSLMPARLSAVDDRGATTLVHYTEWKTTEIGFEIVKAFADEIEAREARSGVLMSFGHLTRAASSFAASSGIEVICGERLTRVLRSSGWDSSRFRESKSGSSTSFGNSRLP